MPFPSTPESEAPRGEAARVRLPVHAGSAAAVGRAVAQYELRCSLRVPLPIADVFCFFEDPRNLALITPPWLSFRIRTESPLVMRRSLVIDYTIRLMGVPLGWTSVITAYDTPRRFVDEQVRGPYRYWHHRHDFKADGEGTLIVDRVLYSLPFGILGRIAHAVMVRWQLLAIFRYRQRGVARRLGVECNTVEPPVIGPAH